MAKGITATSAVLLLAASAALAQPARAADGCATLERVVRESVDRAATEYRPPLPEAKADPAFPGGALALRQACFRTVEVTTGAFTRAMADLGLAIGWYPPHPGDFCWSGNLSHCYPDRDPDGPVLSANQLAFVYDAWKGVRNAVISHMRQGTSGVSTFTGESLEASLRSNLQVTVEGPLYLGYPTY